jgi:hypothetical protein
MLCTDCGARIEHVQCSIDPRAAAHRFTAGCGHDVAYEDARRLWRTEGLRWHVPPLRGSTLIDAERARHTSEEGYTPESDAQHTGNELPWAAWCLLDRAAKDADPAHTGPPATWPLPRDRWPRTSDPLRLLVIAGSFIAAEIDRRLTAREKP